MNRPVLYFTIGILMHTSVISQPAEFMMRGNKENTLNPKYSIGYFSQANLRFRFQTDPIKNLHLQESFNFDTRLIGEWTYTTQYNSGGFWGNTTEKILVSKDGSISFFEPTVYVSTPDGFGSSSEGKLIATIKLLTKGNQLYVINPESQKEVFISEFIIEGNKMLTTTSQGEKQLWEK